MADRGRMLKIDIHTHILPPVIPKFKEMFGYEGFISLKDCPGCTAKEMVDDSGKVFRRVEENTFNPEARLKDSDKFGVQVQVLSTVPVMFSYWTKPQDGLKVSQILNDHISEVVRKNPKRFVGLGTLPMQSPDLAVIEAKRCIQELGLKGFQIGSHVNDWNLSDKALFPIYEVCEKLGAAIFVHPWDMMGQDKMSKYWLPWLVGMPAETSLAVCSMIFGGVFAKFPKLRVAFAHGGGAYPITMDRIQHGFEVRPDLCAIDSKIAPKDYTGHFWMDSLVHGKEALLFLKNRFGANRICLGTDYPFPLGELEPGKLINESEFSLEEKEKIFHGSALEWLAMKKTDF
ncbi:MAG: amidohydrolase family protein [Bdellovibrionota bacterium]